MKKIILTVLVAVAALCSVSAQPRAIGARLLGYGFEASYQHGFGDKNFLEVDLGLPGYHSVQATAVYNWIFANPKWTSKGEWNWYAGVGGGLGYSFWNNHDNYTYFGVAGQVGLEYTFWFPLQLSADIRPVLGPGFTGNDVVFHDDFGSIFCPTISARYRF